MMQRKRRKKKNWSYNAGERGRNWVRAFQQARDGRYFVEWFDEHRKRRAALLKGVTDPNQAKARGLIAHSSSWKFAAMLRLGRETLRRNSSIRQLLWSDIDLRAETIRWRAESDKAGRASVTPMTPAAVEVIRSLPRGIGDVPVFPGRAGRPVSRHGPQLWLRRAKARWIRSVPKEQREELRARLRGVGFHAEKRAGVRDPSFRELPVAVQEALTGTNAKTLRTIYDRVEVDEMRTYMKRASQASE